MAIINQEGLLSSLVPDVFIRKITLETSGADVNETNPHIDSEREPNVVRNRDGKLVREVVNPDLLKKSSSSESMTINVDFLLKEKLNDNLVSSWFGEQDFLKYIKIRVVQCTNENLTNLFATKKLSLNLTSFDSNVFNFRNSIDYRIIPIKSLITDSSLDSYETYVDENGNEIYDISFRLTYRLKNSNPKHLSYFALSFLDLKELSADFNLDLPPGSEKTINGKIASEIAIKDCEIVSEGYIFQDENAQIWTGQVHQIANGRWKTGEVESKTSKFLELLTVPNNKVQDCRDFKEIERLQIDFSIVENEIFKTDRKVKFSANSQFNFNKKKSYFSDGYISRDKDGNVRFAFSVNYAKLIKENTLFGSLYRGDNEDLLDENVRIKSLKVLRARVKSDNNVGIKDERGLCMFDEDEEPIDIIISSAEKEPHDFQEMNNRNGSLKEIKIYLENDDRKIRYFTGVDRTMSKVTFGHYQYGVELEIEDRTQSFLLFKLDDLLFAHQVLSEYYNEALNANNFDVMSNRFKQDFIETQENKYSNEDAAIAPWILSISAYLSTMDMLIRDFSAQKYELNFLSFVHPRTGNPDGISMVLNLIEKLSVKIGNIVGSNITSTVRKFESGKGQWRPASTLQRSETALKTFKIETFFNFVFNSDVPKKYGYDFFSFNKQRNINLNNDGLIVISNKNYKERTQKETLKYFRSLDVDINMKTDRTQYTMNDNIENARYAYLTPSVVEVGDSSFEFLEKGENIFEPVKNQQLASNIVRYNASFNSPFVPLVSLGANTNSPHSNRIQSIKNNLESTLVSRNMIIRNVRNVRRIEDDTISVSETSQDRLPFVDANKMVGTSSVFLKEDLISREQLACLEKNDDEEKNINTNKFLFTVVAPIITDGIRSSLIENKAAEQKRKTRETIKFYDLKYSENAIDLKTVVNNDLSNRQITRKPLITKTDNSSNSEILQSTSNTSKQEFIKYMPNQIKSLFLGSIRQDVVLKNWHGELTELDPLKDVLQKPTFDFNYNILSKIEVLSGYEVGTENDYSYQMKSPIWKVLTPERFNSSLQKNLLCRLSEYQQKELGVRMPEAFRMPVYNEYFIISPQEKIVKLVPMAKISKYEQSRTRIVDLNNKAKVQLKPEYSNSLITANTMVPLDDVQINTISTPTQPLFISEPVGESKKESLGKETLTSKIQKYRIK